MALTLARTDDLDGSLGAAPVRFGLRDKDYEIDLGPDGQQRLEKALEPFLRVAREIAPGPSATSGTTLVSAKEIREWARSRGIRVPQYGRVSAVVEQRFLDEFLGGEAPVEPASSGDLPEITEDDRGHAALFYRQLSDFAVENLHRAVANGGCFPETSDPGVLASIRALRKKEFALDHKITGAGLAAIVMYEEWKRRSAAPLAR